MKQKGFVLVSVLVITTITTMLAFSQLKTNSLQERMAGNQQKEINARLDAEKGIFDALKEIKVQRELGLSNDHISTNLNTEDIVSNSSGNIFVLASTGKFGGATAYLKAILKTSEESEEIFDNAIVACDGVTVLGSAKIDSFKGQSYADSISENGTIANGNVKVINGVVTLGNGSGSDNKGVFGNVTAKSISGSLDLIKGGGTAVTGYEGDPADCYPLSITDLMTNIANEGGTDRLNYSSSDDFTDGNTYVYDDFNISQNDIVITGDVIVYIKGNMTTANTTFTLSDTTPSSLTIYIKGAISIGAQSNIFADQYVSDNGKIPLTVYSSKNTADAVTLSGNGDIYMNLYAPLGTVAYTGNGNIMGAIRGKIVNISSNGGLHYDEGLGGIESSSSITKVSYCAIYYYYPEDPSAVETLNAGVYSGYCGEHISPFESYAAIAGGYISIAASSTVNGALAAQGYVSIGANSVVQNIYAGDYVTTDTLSDVKNIFSVAATTIAASATAQTIYAGAAVTIGGLATAKDIYAEAAVTIGAGGDVKGVYAGAGITGTSYTGVLTEEDKEDYYADEDDYAETGDIHNADNMTDTMKLITDTQIALSELEPSPENGTLAATMGTRTLAPGVWEGSALTITASSTITFDADESTDNEDYVWVINLSDALTVGASTNFEIIGLDDTDNATIIWNVGAALTMGAGTSFRGTAFVGGPITAATSSVSCGHLYATGLISIGSIGVDVDSEGDAVSCENSDAVFTYLEALD
jgi:hypothetical protein